jgi:hypothetical protein
MGVGALRVPGLVSMLSTGLAEIVAHGTRLLAEFGLDGSDNGDDRGDE